MRKNELIAAATARIQAMESEKLFLIRVHSALRLQVEELSHRIWKADQQIEAERQSVI